MKSAPKQLSHADGDANEQARIQLRPSVRKAWGDWVASMPWTHFATLTFANESSEARAKREFGRWIRWLEQRSRHPVGYVLAIERGRGGWLHLHALVDCDDLSAATLRLTWHAGRSDVRDYDPKLAAAHYVTKEIAGSVIDYDVRLQSHWA